MPNQFNRKSFVPIHPPNVLGRLAPKAHLGPLDPMTLPVESFQETEEEVRIARERSKLPGPSAALNLYDIEVRWNTALLCLVLSFFFFFVGVSLIYL